MHPFRYAFLEFSDENPAVGCIDSPGNGAWFWVAPESSGIFDIQAFNSNVSDPETADGAGWSYVAVFDATDCDSSRAPSLCATQGSDTAFLRTELQAGTEYRILVHTSVEENILSDPGIILAPFEPDPGETCALARDPRAP